MRQTDCVKQIQLIGASKMKCTMISVDLSKHVFQVCGVNDRLKPQFNKKLSRDAFINFMRQQQPTIVVMEACYSAHYWGRVFNEMGHTARLIPAQHVTPFVRGNKNDHNDALAIAEASARPNIRFVPVKTSYQQEIMALHKIKERLLKSRIALTNQSRGLLSDFGIIFNKGDKAFVEAMLNIAADEHLSENVKAIAAMQYQEYKELASKIKTVQKSLNAALADNPQADILQSIPGIGPTIASALLASIDSGQAFKSPRDFAVWLGLTPRQYASGMVNRLSGITKRGDRYLRQLLIHGARALLTVYKNKDDYICRWGTQIAQRSGFNKAVVAVAHRLARLAWILLQKQTPYKANPQIGA